MYLDGKQVTSNKEQLAPADPNVEVVAVSHLFPDRCAGLAEACRCEKAYPSLEELVKKRYD